MRVLIGILIGLCVGILGTSIYYAQSVRGYEDQVAGFRIDLQTMNSGLEVSTEDTQEGIGKQVRLASFINKKTGKLQYDAMDPEFIALFQATTKEVTNISASGKRIIHSDPNSRTGIKNVYFDPWNTVLVQIRHAEILLRNGERSEAKVLALSALSILKTFCTEAVLPPHILSSEMQKLLSDYYRFRPYPEDWTALTAEIGGC